MDDCYDMKVGYNHQVNVTHVNDPKSFYVRSTKAEKSFIQLIECRGIGPVYASELSDGQLVIYKSKILQKFVRGKILSISNDGEDVNCDIFAIDYGCFDKSIFLNHIFLPHRNSAPQNQCPGLAFHCQFSLCEPKEETFNQEVIDSMKFFIGKHPATMTIISKVNDQLVVELRTVDAPRDVATTMALIGLTTMTKGPYTVNRLTSSMGALSVKKQVLQYTHKQLNVGDMLYVRVQSGTEPSGFYVAEVKDFKMLRQDHAGLAHHCKSRLMKDEDIVPGRACAVKLTILEEYDRAIIKKVNPNSKAVVQLVDLGTEIECDISCLRSIDKEFFLTLPIIAIYCSTTKNQLWKSPYPNFFSKSYEFGIKILELGNNSDKPHKVDLYPMHLLKIDREGNVRV